MADGITWTPTTRGFTDHEQLRAVGLVHMNGRVFDPHIGRMTSADPLVPHPLRAQSFNRYSYTQNNPLSRTDPSGYSDFTDNPIPANPSGVPEPADVPLSSFDDFIRVRTGPAFAEEYDRAWNSIEYQDLLSTSQAERIKDADVAATVGVNASTSIPYSGGNSAVLGEREPSSLAKDFKDAWRLYHREIIDGSFDGARENGGSFFIGLSGGESAKDVLYGVVDGDGKAVVIAASGLLLGKLKALEDIPWGVFCRSGCSNVAARIHDTIGGKVYTIVPGLPGARFLGHRGGLNTEWQYHKVVVKDGRVYDALTGPEGLTVEEFKKLWEYADDIDFGF